MARSSRGAGISRRTLLGGMAATPLALGARSALAQEASQPIATPKPTLSPGPNAVQLKYWDMQWGSAIFMSAMQDLVTDFNAEHPEIYVSFQQLSWADYMQKILSAIESGAPPDMSGGDSGIAFNMAAQDEALDLTDVYKEWEADGTLADMTEWSRQKWLWNDMQVGVTWQFDSRAIYYRKDLFADAGIDVPTTWEEFHAAAKALHKPDQGITGLAIPGKQGSFDTDQFYMTLVIQAGGGLADPEGNLTIDSPENLEALKFEKDLVDTVTPRGTASWTFTEVLKAFEQGQAAMAFGGGWYIADMERNAPDIFKNAGVLPPLVGPGGKESAHIVSFANPWMIYKPTEHPDEAKTFLKWMMKPENLRKLYAAEPGAKWPAYQSLVKDPIYQSNEMLATLAKQTVENGVDYWYPNNAAAVGIASMGTSITDIVVNPVITGNVSPEDALAEAQSRLEPLFRRPD